MGKGKLRLRRWDRLYGRFAYQGKHERERPKRRRRLRPEDYGHVEVVGHFYE